MIHLTPIAERPPVLNEGALSGPQKTVFDAIQNGPRKIVQGPLRVWVNSPELAARAQDLGAFCRYQTLFPQRLSELAILVTGAFWQSGFEWSVHAPIALESGISADIIEAIRTHQRPVFVQQDEEEIYEFAHELHTKHKISDRVYAQVVARFGVQGATELVGILGYYTLISMTINAFNVPVPEGEVEPFA